MNKTIIININSIVFHIEEDGYEKLRAYMIDIKKHFGKSSDSKEILLDIENRIAEMFSERIQSGRKEVINLEDVDQVINQMGRVSDFESENFADEQSYASSETSSSFNDNRESSGEKRLMRDPDDKTLGGVCSGLAHYFGLEAKWVRLAFVVFFLFAGTGVFLYIVLWAVMPLATTRADRMAMRGEAPNLQNFKKSFDEEMSGIRDNFSGATENIKRGASKVGDGIGDIFRWIGKFFGVIFTLFIGLNILGLFIFFVMVNLALAGYLDFMPFPPLEVLNSTDAFFAFTAGWLALVIPFVALFSWLIRSLFRLKPMNNYVSLLMFSAWLISLIVMFYFIIVANKDFREQSSIKVEKKLDVLPVYYFDERNVREIEATDVEYGSKKFKINISGDNLNNKLRSNIGIRFEQVDSLSAPYIQYRYFAKGKTYQQAADRAAQIDYQAKLVGDKIIFDSHFQLSKNEVYRDQYVEATVYLPIGSKVVIMNNLDNKIQDLSTFECRNAYDNENESIKSTDWIMTKSGLKCTPKLDKDERNKDDE